MDRTINAETRVAAVLGWPVAHSLSPAIQNAAFRETGFNGVFLAYQVAPNTLAEAIAGMRACGYLGASITVPHKHDVRALCDHTSEAAQRIGAVNCIVFEPGGLVMGHNTDALGFRDALLSATHKPIAGAQVTLLGAGGAARAVAYGLSEAGASVGVIARSPHTVAWTSSEAWQAEVLAKRLPHTDFLIDCTSAGLSAETEDRLPCEIPLHLLSPESVVCTLVYHRQTRLLRDAATLGLQTMNGTGMLVHQGAHAFALWTGLQAPIAAMHAALMEVLSMQEND